MFKQIKGVRNVSKMNPYLLIGLQNTGNLCYLNAVMQMLFSIVPLNRVVFQFCQTYKAKGVPKPKILLILQYYEYLKGLQFLVNTNGHRKIDQTSILRLDNFFALLCTLKSNLLKSEQEDAHETLNYLLNIFNDVVVPQKTTTKSTTTNLFQGLFQTKITCSLCFTEKDIFEKFYEISLPADTNLLHSFERYFRNELIQYDCPKCNCLQLASKEMSIVSFPQILFLHINRTIMNTTTKVIEKDNTPMYFIPLLQFQGQSHKINYKWCSAIEHHGRSFDYGHYTLRLHYNQSEFVFINDESIVSTNPIQFFNPYILLYEQIK